MTSKACGLTWMHIDHEWTDEKGNTVKCPGIWPHPIKPQK